MTGLPVPVPDVAATHEGWADVEALRALAMGWREVSDRYRQTGDRALQGGDPGPHLTAIQLEWAAKEIAVLRHALNNSRRESS